MSSTLDFCGACSRYATGITVITVLDRHGVPHGMTANSFTSVSLHPPLILVCIDHAAAILAQFRTGEYMGINVLRESQQHLSIHFARPGENGFGEVAWLAGETGIPLIPEVLATFECSIVRAIDAGDHTILIGEVVHARRGEGDPLLYFDRGYRAMGKPL
ncbi:MAG: flavin reductase family protein [Acidobacteriota bacterium]|nr:flavin reductase family protein [Acidobacteriota bacterium]